MANDYLQYPKRRPSMDAGSEFEAYNPQAPGFQAAGAAHPGQQGGGLPEMLGMAASGLAHNALPVASTLFDIYGGMQQAEQADDLRKKAEDAYIEERDKEAAELERQKELQRIKTSFEYGNYAGNQRQGLHSNYDQYYRQIGL